MAVIFVMVACLALILFRWNRCKMSLQQRRDRVKQKKAAFLKTLQAED